MDVPVSPTNVSNESLYAVRHGRLIRIKVFYRLPDGAVQLRSYNRLEYPDEEVETIDPD